MASPTAALHGRRILVTGGAGYIGSHTVVQLLSAGADVVVVDNLDNASPVALERVAELAGLSAGDPRLVLHQVDLRDSRRLDEVVGGSAASAVVHFAGRKSVSESVRRPLEYYDHNVTGTVNLLEAMERHGLRELVFSSSATVYGAAEVVPIPESTPRQGINPYGRSKLVVEHVLEDLAASDPSWHLLALRYFNPVGAHASGRIGEDPNGVPENLMPYLMQVAVGRRDHLSVFGADYDTPDGTCIRDYIHVVDLADAHLAALAAASAHAGFDAINVGTGIGTSVLELLDAASRAVGRPIEHQIVGRRAGDAACAYADTTRAAEVLGWRATRSVDDMCVDHWRWQSANPNGYAVS